MNEKNLQRKELDRIGRRLLETAQISNEEIERIAAAPQLFDSVKARIKTEQNRRDQKRFFAGWRLSPVWNRQRVSVVSAVFTLFVFGIFGLIFTNKFLKINEQAVALPEIQTPIESVEVSPLPPVSEELPEISGSEKAEVKFRPIAQRAAFKQKNKKNTKRKTKPLRQMPETRPRPNGEFYALTYAGNIGETGEELRIFRTELSPSSLFALGVNLPIENAPEKIKTDLLVGSDGVARALRFVE